MYLELPNYFKQLVIKSTITLLEELNLKIPEDKFLDENICIKTSKKKEYGNFSCNILIKLERWLFNIYSGEKDFDSFKEVISIQFLSNKIIRIIETLIASKEFDETENCWVFFIEDLPGMQAQDVVKFKIQTRSRGFINFFILETNKKETKVENFIKEDNGIEVFPIRTIGHCFTCWIEKFGIPKQSTLVPSSRGVIKLLSEFNKDFIYGLDKFSHLWIIFIFNDVDEQQKIKSKVRPPRLNGKSTGIYSTRTPHRINRIGISNVKIESINDNRIYISGVDLLNGTPIIDIKPYHICDLIKSEDLRCPDWVLENNKKSFEVFIPEYIVKKLSDIVDKKEESLLFNQNLLELEKKLHRLDYGGKWPFIFFETKTEFLETLNQCLSQDIRCEYRKRTEVGFLCNFLFSSC